MQSNASLLCVFKTLRSLSGMIYSACAGDQLRLGRQRLNKAVGLEMTSKLLALSC